MNEEWCTKEAVSDNRGFGNIKIVKTSEEQKRIEEIRMIAKETVDKEIKKLNLTELQNMRSTIMEEMRSQMDELFNNVFFVQKFKNDMRTYITEEIRVQIKNNDYYQYVKSSVETILRDKTKGIIENIVDRTFKNVEKKLTADYRRAKDLTYSINAEVKHTMMNLPISSGTEMECKKVIMNILNGELTKLKNGKQKTALLNIV